jgi:hypothetical protein
MITTKVAGIEAPLHYWDEVQFFPMAICAYWWVEDGEERVCDKTLDHKQIEDILNGVGNEIPKTEDSVQGL